MQLKIGENIKRIRTDKKMTQEDLAELMNVSSSAVCKWESGETYPDITAVMPLAMTLGITVDELMGYDSAKAEEEIKGVLDAYRHLEFEGDRDAAANLIRDARKKFPGDYRIMRCYMWDIAGGMDDNDPALLLEHRDEFSRICDCILDGCGDENIRNDAVTMKAKLLFANGDTRSALALLSTLPDYTRTADHKTEQLFPKGSPEYFYYLRRNSYRMADGASKKIIDCAWYKESAARHDPVSKCEKIADSFFNAYLETEESVFLFFGRMAYAELAGKISAAEGNASGITRIREKELNCDSLLDKASKNDDALYDVIRSSCGDSGILKWTVDFLSLTNQACLAALRDDPEYSEMLEKYGAIAK